MPYRPRIYTSAPGPYRRTRSSSRCLLRLLPKALGPTRRRSKTSCSILYSQLLAKTACVTDLHGRPTIHSIAYLAPSTCPTPGTSWPGTMPGGSTSTLRPSSGPASTATLGSPTRQPVHSPTGR
ncbi:hypothetical protein C8T65DRAFT_63572 [Cerioporus squamosus]|nr:hypothetical protein C8T65DRAFT_63572 [Cerioporus squamosus]